MSTENAKQYDVYFAETILKYILSKDELSVALKLVKEGLIDLNWALEKSIAKVNTDILHESVEGRDFSDGSDATKIVSQGGDSPRFVVGNLGNKIGSRRVMGYNKVRKQINYFVIPYEAFEGKEEIKISIDRKTGEISSPTYGKYEVDSFEDMCNKENA